MATRNEQECAYCAEEVKSEARVIGRDWKVYCSGECAARGEALSRQESCQLMQCVSEGHWQSVA